MSLRMLGRALGQVAEEAEKTTKSIEDSSRRTREAVRETNEYIQAQDWGTAMFDSMVKNIPRIERLTTDLIEHMRRSMQENTPKIQSKTSGNQKSSGQTTSARESVSGKAGVRISNVTRTTTTTTTPTVPDRVTGGDDTINGLASKGRLS